MRSTYEDREGTLWVCTVAGLDAFDRRTEKVTERVRLNVPESVSMKVLEDHAGVLWIIYLSGNGLASCDRRARRLTMYSFSDREPLATALSGPQGIHEDADRQSVAGDEGSWPGKDRSEPAERSPIPPFAARSGQHQRGHAHVGV